MKPGIEAAGTLVIFTATSASIVPSWNSTPRTAAKPAPSAPPSGFMIRTAFRPRKSAASNGTPGATRSLVSVSAKSCARTGEASAMTRPVAAAMMDGVCMRRP